MSDFIIETEIQILNNFKELICIETHLKTVVLNDSDPFDAEEILD